MTSNSRVSFVLGAVLALLGTFPFVASAGTYLFVDGDIGALCGGGIHPCIQGFGVPGVRYIGHAFMPDTDGNVTEAATWVDIEAGTPSDQIHYEIWSDASGVPGTVLGTSNSFSPAAQYGAWATSTFSSPVAVTSGNSYWLITARDGSLDGTNYYGIDYQLSGVLQKYFDGSSWTDNGVGQPLVIYDSGTAGGGGGSTTTPPLADCYTLASSTGQTATCLLAQTASSTGMLIVQTIANWPLLFGLMGLIGAFVLAYVIYLAMQGATRQALSVRTRRGFRR